MAQEQRQQQAKRQDRAVTQAASGQTVAGGEAGQAAQLLSGEVQAVREELRQIQDQQARFAVAARVLREKQIISSTPEQAVQVLKQGKQEVGE